MLSSDKKIARIAADSAFVCAALALSYLESLIPLRIILPLPGFKLGLANIAVTVCAFRYSVKDAAAVSLCRILLSFLLFGGVTSLLFSLFGSLLSCAVLLPFTKRRGAGRIGLSFVGISLLCALAHNTGQLIAALVIVGRAVLSYIPMLISASLICGALCGIILCLIPDKIYKI